MMKLVYIESKINKFFYYFIIIFFELFFRIFFYYILELKNLNVLFVINKFINYFSLEVKKENLESEKITNSKN